MIVFERPLKVGKVDNFKFTLASEYLDGETIISATATTASGNLTIDSVANNGVSISAVCTGVLAGSADIEFDWVLESRTGCESHTVTVLDC